MKGPDRPLLHLLACLGAALPLQAAPVRVFVLAGQSNMQGQGAVSTLEWLGEDPDCGKLLGRVMTPDGAFRTRDDVRVIYRRKDDQPPKTGPLGVGFGAADSKIGPELFFGQVVGDRFEDPVLIVKTCWGGRSLAEDFRPPSAGGRTGPSYTAMLEQVADATSRLGDHFPDWEGRQPVITGFVWFQGWNDMIDPGKVAEYEANLRHLIADLRREWKSPALPVVIGTLGVGGTREPPNQRMRDIRRAQTAPAEGPEPIPGVAAVATEELWDEVAFRLYLDDWAKNRKWDDPEKQQRFDRMGNQPAYHYLGSAKIMARIGDAFGRAMVGLLGETDTPP